MSYLITIVQGAKAIRSILPQLMAVQVMAAAVSSYLLIWARNRIFDTMDADPDFVKTLLLTSQETPTRKERALNWMRKYFPFLKSGHDLSPSPETQPI